MTATDAETVAALLRSRSLSEAAQAVDVPVSELRAKLTTTALGETYREAARQRLRDAQAAYANASELERPVAGGWVDLACLALRRAEAWTGVAGNGRE